MKIEVLACDFCQKTQHQVEILIAGPGVMICDECVDLCIEIIAQARKKKSSLNTETLEAPCGS